MFELNDKLQIAISFGTFLFCPIESLLQSASLTFLQLTVLRGSTLLNINELFTCKSLELTDFNCFLKSEIYFALHCPGHFLVAIQFYISNHHRPCIYDPLYGRCFFLSYPYCLPGYLYCLPG